MLSRGTDWSCGRGEGFFLGAGGGGVQVLHLLVGLVGPGGAGEGVVGLTPDVTGHVGRS